MFGKMTAGTVYVYIFLKAVLMERMIEDSRPRKGAHGGVRLGWE